MHSLLSFRRVSHNQNRGITRTTARAQGRGYSEGRGYSQPPFLANLPKSTLALYAAMAGFSLASVLHRAFHALPHTGPTPVAISGWADLDSGDVKVFSGNLDFDELDPETIVCDSVWGSLWYHLRGATVREIRKCGVGIELGTVGWRWYKTWMIGLGGIPQAAKEHIGKDVAEVKLLRPDNDVGGSKGQSQPS